MAAPERTAARSKRPAKLSCGCLIGEEGPIIMCLTGSRLSRRVSSLIPLYGEDEVADWDYFHDALRAYREHVGTRTS